MHFFVKIKSPILKIFSVYFFILVRNKALLDIRLFNLTSCVTFIFIILSDCMIIGELLMTGNLKTGLTTGT